MALGRNSHVCPRCNHQFEDEVGKEIATPAGRAVTLAEAARRLGHSPDWLRLRIQRGVCLFETFFDGLKTLVLVRSIEGYLADAGYPDPLQQALEEAEESGEGWRVADLRAEIQARSDEAERRQFGGYTAAEIVRGAAPGEVPARVQEQEGPIDPIDWFQARFGQYTPGEVRR